MKTDYGKLDAAILAAITRLQNTAMTIECNGGVREHAAPFVNTMTPRFRVIDRRLQALRKQNRIQFINKTWELKK